MHRLYTFLSILTVVLTIISGQAMADELWLKNGDHISGKLVKLEDNILIFSTSYAGNLSIKWEEIANLKTDEPVQVVIGDDTSIKGVVSPGDGGKVTIKSTEIKGPIPMELARLKVINPKPAEPVLKTDVRLNFGASFTDGNTETQNIYGDGELVVRTQKNRYTLGGIYKRSESINITTADSLIGYMKYDHFLSKKWYLYANATGEKDEFKDLNLRTSLGIGPGYQFFETELRNLSLEAGISYVNKDYLVAEDDAYLGGRWGLRFDQYFLKKAIQFFHYNTGIQSFEDSNDFVLFTQTGFRVPVYKNLNTTLQLNYDYDKNPAPGKVKEDSALIFTLGYQWSG